MRSKNSSTFSCQSKALSERELNIRRGAGRGALLANMILRVCHGTGMRTQEAEGNAYSISANARAGCFDASITVIFARQDNFSGTRVRR